MIASIKTFIVGLFANIGAFISNVFTKFSTIQKVSLGMTLASMIMAYGDRNAHVAGMPGWVAHCWPYVFGGASIFYKYGHIFFPDATTYTAAQVQQLAKQAIDNHVAALQASGVIPATTPLADHISATTSQKNP